MAPPPLLSRCILYSRRSWKSGIRGAGDTLSDTAPLCCTRGAKNRQRMRVLRSFNTSECIYVTITKPTAAGRNGYSAGSDEKLWLHSKKDFFPRSMLCRDCVCPAGTFRQLECFCETASRSRYVTVRTTGWGLLWFSSVTHGNFVTRVTFFRNGHLFTI
jgi:hypothetical protein